MDLVRNIPRLLTVLALLTWMGIILFVSSRSSLQLDSAAVSWLRQYQDEVGHLGEYAILGLLTYVFLRSSMARRQAVLVGLAFCVFFALGESDLPAAFLSSNFPPGKQKNVSRLYSYKSKKSAEVLCWNNI